MGMNGQWEEVSDWGGEVHRSPRKAELRDPGGRDGEVISIGLSQSLYPILPGIFQDEKIVF